MTKKSKKSKSGKVEKSGVMVRSFYERYRKNGGDNKDGLSRRLTEVIVFIDRGKSGRANRRRIDPAKLRAVAKENGIDFAAYDGLNVGMLRMNVANVLRGKIRAGGEVTIDGKKVSRAALA